MHTEGIIFNIQHFSLHDGPGIRTTVFLKGCPMRCRWCHNPESLSPMPQLSLTAVRCIGCGRCAEVCPNGVHRPGNTPNFSACKACGACAAACPTAALELLGKRVTVENVLEEVLQDAVFYSHSGGGMTVSGGEPGMQPEFTTSLLRRAKEHGIHTAIETAGWVDGKVYEQMLPWLDLVLFDIKQMDPQKHFAYTQRDFDKIHNNLRNLCRFDRKVKVTVRTPVIPGYTDDPESFQKLAEFLHTLDRLPDVNVLPYNPLAGAKHPRLGKEYLLEGTTEADGTAPDDLCRILTGHGIQAKVIR